MGATAVRLPVSAHPPERRRGAGCEPTPSEVHDPAAGLAAGAVLVHDRAGAARPVLPPDPLEVVHLEDEEGDDPHENLGPRHVSNVSAVSGGRQWAVRPNSGGRGSQWRS